MKSWKPVVKTDDTGKWYDNALRFATHKEALTSAGDLAMRWVLVWDWDAHLSEDPVNYKIVDGVQVALQVTA